MECRYCQAANAEDDHRCRRCGRRLRMSPVYTGSQRPRRFCNIMLRRFCNIRAVSAFCNTSPGAQRAAPPDHLSTLALYIARTAARGAVRNHRTQF